MVKFRIFIPELWDFIHQIVCGFKAIFRMSRCKLRTPLPIHFKLRIVIGIDNLMACILFDEIQQLHHKHELEHLYNIYVEIKHYNSFKSHNSGMKNRNFTKKYTDRKTINSNNCAKFEVNWPRDVML
jgi:hypothetical protein